MSTLCKSVKSKTFLNVQCCNKAKLGEILCGTHLKSKNIILYQESSDNIPNMEIDLNDVDIKTKESLNKSMNDVVHVIDSSINDKKSDIIIYTKDELFQKISSDQYINIGSIRKSIKKCKLLNWINIKLSKQCLITIIKKEIEKERYYLSNIDSIIKIQSYARRFLVNRVKQCSNDTDILTFTNLYHIEMKYFYIFDDNVTGKKYGYDFRTLLEIINSDYSSCPYTIRNFTTDEKESVFKHRDYLIKKGIDVRIEKTIMSPEEEIDMRIKDVFHKINMLDNYTNPVWFKNLNIFQLYELYLKSEDIWNYRSGMSIEYKKKIVKNGCVFNIPHHIVKSMSSKINIQHIILSEFMRMITEGVDREEKKLGALFILTALVEVSPDAADALPHLLQI
jgi:hypothetical protein